MMPRKISPEMAEHIINLRENKHTLESIHRETGVSTQTISRILQKQELGHGYRIARTGLKPIPHTRFIDVWQTSESLIEVSDRLSVSTKYATACAKKYRANGVQLKVLPRTTDWKYLAKYAERVISLYRETGDKRDDHDQEPT